MKHAESEDQTDLGCFLPPLATLVLKLAHSTFNLAQH